MNMPVSQKLAPEDKVILNDGDKCKLVELSDVRYFETYGNYSKTYFSDGTLLINRSLHYLESRLSSRHFFRANRQYVVNLSHVDELRKSGGGQYKLVLSCGKEIEVSRRRSLEFQQSHGL